MDRRFGYENIIIRAVPRQTRKQMLAKVDEIADFTELGEYLTCRCDLLPGMRCVGDGRGPSIDPEILLLDEGIARSNAEFMKKARTGCRLGRSLRNPGVL